MKNQTENQRPKLYPEYVLTPRQAAKFIGCNSRNVRKFIQPDWWDGNIPKFLGKTIIEYQEKRLAEAANGNSSPKTELGKALDLR